MAKKFNLSITIPVVDGFSETLTIEGCDSIDEAYRILEKCVKERLNELGSRAAKQQPVIKAGPIGPILGGPAIPPAPKEPIRVEVDRKDIPGANQPGVQVPDMIQEFREAGDAVPARETRVK